MSLICFNTISYISFVLRMCISISISTEAHTHNLGPLSWSFITLVPSKVLFPPPPVVPLNSRGVLRVLPAWEQMLSPFVFHFLDFTRGLSITTPEQMIEKAKGETAYLPCKFTLGPEDQGPLDIEWLLSPADNQKVDQVVSAAHSADVGEPVFGVCHCVDTTGGGTRGAVKKA